MEIGFSADATATIDVSRLTIRGEGKTKDGNALVSTAVLPAPRGQPQTDTVLLAVALPTPFKIVGDYESTQSPRGSVRHRHYKIERGGYDGPIEVSLSDRQARHLQGVRGPTIVVPAGASEFDYAVELPPWMELGRTSRSLRHGRRRRPGRRRGALRQLQLGPAERPDHRRRGGGPSRAWGWKSPPSSRLRARASPCR